MAELKLVEHSILVPTNRPPETESISHDEVKGLGVLLFDVSSGNLLYRIRHDIDTLIPDSALSSFTFVESIVERLIRAHGGRSARDLLTSEGVDGLRASAPESAMVEDVPLSLFRLYREAVGAVALRKF